MALDLSKMKAKLGSLNSKGGCSNTLMWKIEPGQH